MHGIASHRLQDLLDHLSGVEASIKFIVEIESEGWPPFLDVQLHCGTDSTISTTVTGN